MTDREYLSELADHLSVLPDIEREAALSFYKSVFDNSGNAFDVMLKYGNPYALAKRVISEHSDFNETEQYKNLKKDGMTASSQQNPADQNYSESAYEANKEFTRDDGTDTNAAAHEEHLIPQPYGFSNAKGQLDGGYRADYRKTTYADENIPNVKTANASYSQPGVNTNNVPGYMPPPQKPEENLRANGTPGYIPPPGTYPGSNRRQHRIPMSQIRKNNPDRNKIRKRNNLIIGAIIACLIVMIPIVGLVQMRQYESYSVEQIADFTMMPPAPIAPEAPEYPFADYNGDYADSLLPAVDYDYSYETESFAAAIHSVSIVANNCDIRISNGSVSSIEYSSGVEFNVVDGALTVTSANPGAVVNINLSGIGNNVDLSLNGGSVVVSNITLDTMNINYIGTGSNGVIISNCTVNRTAICDVVAPNATLTVEDSTFGVNSKFSSSGTDMMIYGCTFDTDTVINSDAGYTAINGCSFKSVTLNTYANDTYMDSTSLKGDMILSMRGGTGNFNISGFPEYYNIALADPNALPAAEEALSNYKIILDTNGVTQNDLSITFTPPI